MFLYWPLLFVHIDVCVTSFDSHAQTEMRNVSCAQARVSQVIWRYNHLFGSSRPYNLSLSALRPILQEARTLGKVNSDWGMRNNIQGIYTT